MRHTSELKVSGRAGDVSHVRRTVIYVIATVGSYVVSVDWDAINKDQISLVVTAQSLVGVSIIGFAIGFLTQAIAVFAAVIQREGVTLFAWRRVAVQACWLRGTD